MAEGPAQVVLAETPAAQDRRGVAVGHRHGPAGLPEPAEQGLDGEVLPEGPGDKIQDRVDFTVRANPKQRCSRREVPRRYASFGSRRFQG